MSYFQKAESLANRINSIPIRNRGSVGTIESLIKRFLKWLVHWNSEAQADFNLLVAETVARNGEKIVRLEERLRTLEHQVVPETDSEMPAQVGGSANQAVTRDAIRNWIGDSSQWPSADSYDLNTLNPCSVLAQREQELAGFVPPWFWHGEAGSTMLSVGAGKGYFERKYWRAFDKIYMIDPSDRTALSLQYFPVRNGELIGTSIFNISPRIPNLPTHCWMGACIHYLFGEFHSWSFMKKLAMMVSDTVVIDGGVFDGDAPQGRYLLEQWQGEDQHEKQRHAQFSFKQFMSSLDGLWEVVHQRSTEWTTDGRRNLVLKRSLPQIVQKSELGPLLKITSDKSLDSRAVHKCRDGYFKESRSLAPLLMYQVVSRSFGWTDLVLYRVFDGDEYVGFVAGDYGDTAPESSEVSEELLVRLMNWSLPLGMIPADTARDNVRLHNGEVVWIDVTLVGLQELDARGALWATTNTYKQYPHRTKGKGKQAG